MVQVPTLAQTHTHASNRTFTKYLYPWGYILPCPPLHYKVVTHLSTTHRTSSFTGVQRGPFENNLHTARHGAIRVPQRAGAVHRQNAENPAPTSRTGLSLGVISTCRTSSTAETQETTSTAEPTYIAPRFFREGSFTAV